MDNINFETTLSRLEALVCEMEKGDLSLEESLKRFEEGVHLSKSCSKILNEAEKKVEMLLSDQAEEGQTKPFVQTEDA